jgi:hypothetical protein
VRPNQRCSAAEYSGEEHVHFFTAYQRQHV